MIFEEKFILLGCLPPKTQLGPSRSRSILRIGGGGASRSKLERLDPTLTTGRRLQWCNLGCPSPLPYARTQRLDCANQGMTPQEVGRCKERLGGISIFFHFLQVLPPKAEVAQVGHPQKYILLGEIRKGWPPPLGPVPEISEGAPGWPHLLQARPNVPISYGCLGLSA